MLQLILKGLISGAVVVTASEVARRSSVLAALVVSLPLTSILALSWLYLDTRDAQQVVQLSWAILWIIVPSLVFFVALPALVRLGVGVPAAIAGACVITALSYAAYIWALHRFAGVEL